MGRREYNFYTKLDPSIASSTELWTIHIDVELALSLRLQCVGIYDWLENHYKHGSTSFYK